MLYFIQEARAYKQILIRPEVEERIERGISTTGVGTSRDLP